MQRASQAIGLFGIAVGVALLATAVLGYRHSVPAAHGEHSTALPMLILLTSITAGVLAVGGLLLTPETNRH